MTDNWDDIVVRLQENAAHFSHIPEFQPYESLLNDAVKEIHALRRQITLVSEARDLDEDLVLFSLEYVADLLGLSERRVRTMVQRGEIPHIYAAGGRYKRIRQSDLRKYLESKYKSGTRSA